jgi:hypothetical protein
MFFRPMMPILGLPLVATTQFHALASSIPFENSRDVAQQQDGSLSKSSAGCFSPDAGGRGGVDFNYYRRGLYLSVKKRGYANMPPSIEKGQPGTITIEFRVLQDASVPKDSLRMVERRSISMQPACKEFARRCRSIIYPHRSRNRSWC